MRASAADEVDRGTRAGPETDDVVQIAQVESTRIAAALNEIDCVLRDRPVDEHLVGTALQLHELLERDDLFGHSARRS